MRKQNPLDFTEKEEAFFELAERLRSSKDSEEAKQLGDELGRFVFGE